jgi:hypothetical protein
MIQNQVIPEQVLQVETMPLRAAIPVAAEKRNPL